MRAVLCGCQFVRLRANDSLEVDSLVIVTKQSILSVAVFVFSMP